MKLAINQIGDYVSINDGRSTTTYTLEEFNEFLFGMRSARELIQPGRPNRRYFELFRNFQSEEPRRVVPEDLHEILKDLFEEGENETV